MNSDSDRDILLVSVFTFLTVLSWIFFELIKTAKTTTVSHKVQNVITPLDSTIDTGVLNIIENRDTYF